MTDKPIPTWRERCETHPDHNGIVTRAMIEARMVEEIDDLRAEVERLRGEAAVMRELLRRCNAVLLTIEPESAAEHEAIGELSDAIERALGEAKGTLL